MHHSKANLIRFYLLRTSDGRNLIQIDTISKTVTYGLDTYLNTKDDSLVKIAWDPKDPPPKKKQQ